MPVLMYLSYGTNDHFARETRFSIMTALHHIRPTDGVQLLVCTDRIAPFEDLPVQFHLFDAQHLACWSGEHRYFHRAKNRAMNEVLLRWCEPTILVDSDTVFIAPPNLLFERIHPQHSIMHADEGPITNGLFPEVVQCIVRLENEKQLNIFGGLLTAHMWNSGLVGLHPADRVELDRGCTLMDIMYPAGHIFNVEQFALGAVLQRRTSLRDALDVVDHYWGGRRPFFRRELVNFFSTEESLATKIRRSQSLRPTGQPLSIADHVKLRWYKYARRAEPTAALAIVLLQRAFASEKEEIAEAFRLMALHALRTRLLHLEKSVYEGDNAARWAARSWLSTSDLKWTQGEHKAFLSAEQSLWQDLWNRVKVLANATAR